MGETIDGGGFLQRDIDELDQLDDDDFRDTLARRLDSVAGNTLFWRMLCHPTLVERTLGCLEEIADELSAEVTRRRLLPTHYEAKRLNVLNHRIGMVNAAMVRATGRVHTIEDKLTINIDLVRRLALAVDAHRLACIGQNLAPEPHDLALWEKLDEFRLPRHGVTGEGHSLAEQIAAGRWQHPVEVTDRG